MSGYEPKVFATDLGKQRQAKGWTQMECATRLGVRPQCINRIESGVRNITFPIACKAVQLFGSLVVSYNGDLYKLSHHTQQGGES